MTEQQLRWKLQSDIHVVMALSFSRPQTGSAGESAGEDAVSPPVASAWGSSSHRVPAECPQARLASESHNASPEESPELTVPVWWAGSLPGQVLWFVFSVLLDPTGCFWIVWRHKFFHRLNRNDIFRSVDKTQFRLFHPSLEDMVEAEKLFYSSPSHKIDYYVSAERMDHAPALKQPEVSGQHLSHCEQQVQCFLKNYFYIYFDSVTCYKEQ